MKQTPSALKWLAERRARVAHELEQARRIASEHAKRAESLALGQESLDRLIRLYDRSIDPECIESIHGWRGRYGKRGGVRRQARGLEPLVWVREWPTEHVVMRLSEVFGKMHGAPEKWRQLGGLLPEVRGEWPAESAVHHYAENGLDALRVRRFILAAGFVRLAGG